MQSARVIHKCDNHCRRLEAILPTSMIRYQKIYMYGAGFETCTHTPITLQTYKARYEDGKRVYEEEMAEFMQELGGKQEQDAYLKSLAEYREKRRAYRKHFKLKKLGLLKVRKGCVSSFFFLCFF